MKNLWIFDSDPDFLDRLSRELTNKGYRFRAGCNDPDKALGLITACQKSDDPVQVLLASASMDDSHVTSFLWRVKQDFPEVATLVVEQDKAWGTAIDVFSGNGKLADIIGEVVAGSADLLVRRQAIGQAIDRFRKSLQGWANSPDFVERFLDEVLAFPFLKVERGSIFFLDERRERMVLHAARTDNGPELVGLTKSLGEGVAGYVAQEKKPLLVVSRETAPIPLTFSHARYETESFICAPILNNGRLIGVLNLTEKKSKKPFNETDLDVVMAVLDQFSANIEQAFQHRNLRDEIRTLETMIQGSQRNAGMGEIVEGVAHEINSALDAAIRFINIALKKAAGNESLCDRLSDAKLAVERIWRIVKRVNKYTRNGNRTFVETNLTDLLNDVLVLLSHKLTKHKIRVVKRFDPELPTISARSDLDQVPFNLIKNAIEAMKPGGTLEISTASDEENVFIRFKDTGCGIPEEVLSRLGKRGVTTKENGTGLGINICREIINEHGGELTVESEVGAGSTFTLRLPLEKRKKGN